MKIFASKMKSSIILIHICLISLLLSNLIHEVNT